MEYVQERFGQGVDEVNILFTGDWHAGHPNYIEEIVDDALETISSLPNGRIVLMGDLTEIALTTTYGSTYEQVLTPEEQVDYVVEKLRPYKDIIVGAVAGNHNQRIVNAVGMNPMRLAFKILGIEQKFFGYTGIIKWAFNKGCIHSRVWHGATSSSRKMYILKKIAEMREGFFSEICVMGHTHRLLYSDDEFIRIPDSRNMKMKKVNLYEISSGSALGWPEGYAEMKDLKEVKLGFPILKLTGERGNIEVNANKLEYIQDLV